jgi:cyclase
VQHFQLEQVADDAWAALATPEGGAVANAGIVRVSDTTIVFDTSMSADAALELRAAAERLGRVVAAVCSHWHADHVNGNIAFADVDIVSTFRTRELIEARDRERLDGFETTLPNELFEEQILVDGIPVETLGGGHTESDAFIWFEDTLFAGDLVVVQNHPWVGHGDPEHWIEILEAFEARGPRTIVPGHGAVGGAADIAPLRRYLEALLEGTAEPVEGWAFAEGHAHNVESLAPR